MTRLLILIFGALALTAAPAPQTPPAIPKPTPPASELKTDDDPLYEDLRKVLELDEAAEDEVDQWIRTEQQFRATGGGVGDATLRARVLQRLQPVRLAYEDFIFNHPKYVPARIAFGSFLNDLQDEDGARDQWEKARELEPDNPAIWNNLANLYGHGGPIAKAFEYYEKAITLNPQEPIYYQNFATSVFLFRKDAMEYYHCEEPAVFDRSLDLYRKAIALKPDDFVLASDYAISFYGIKPPASLSPEERQKAQDKLNQDAINAWEYALKIADDDVQREGVQIHLARIKINAGQFDEARAHLDAVTNSIYLETRNLLTRNLDKKLNEHPANP